MTIHAGTAGGWSAPAPPRQSLAVLLAWGAALALLAWSWKGADMRPLALVRDANNMGAYAAGFFPPNFSEWRGYLKEMVITLQIALWGTALAADPERSPGVAQGFAGGHEEEGAGILPDLRHRRRRSA